MNGNKKTKLLLDIETTGLSPYENEIIGFSYILDTGVTRHKDTVLRMNGESEEYVLQKLTDLINVADEIYTWNGDNFDIPFIKLRMSRYGGGDEFRGKKIIDMRKEFPRIYGRYPSLEEICRFYGYPIKEQRGSEVVRYWYSRDVLSIKRYMVAELDSLEAVFDLVKRWYE